MNNTELQQQKIESAQLNQTGTRLILLLSALSQKPCSMQEIIDSISNSEILPTKFSEDTIRNDLNILRTLGCVITKATKSTNNKHSLLEHPFNLDINSKTRKSLSNLYKQTHTKLSIDEILSIESLITKLAEHTTNKDVQNEILSMSKLNRVNKDLVKTLQYHAKSKHKITFAYKNATNKNISLIADELKFRHGKLYLYGLDTKTNKNSFFPVKNISKVVSVDLKHEEYEGTKVSATYKFLGYTKNFIPAPNQTVLEVQEDGAIIKLTENNNFILLQNILRLGKNCIVIGPEDFKQQYIKTIKQMREVYKND